MQTNKLGRPLKISSPESSEKLLESSQSGLPVINFQEFEVNMRNGKLCYGWLSTSFFFKAEHLCTQV